MVRAESRAGLKVLHVMPSFYPAHSYGGPIQSVYALCRYLPRAGCEVRVLTTDANGREAVLHVPKEREVELAPGVRIRYCRRVAADSMSPTLLGALPGAIAWADVVHLTAVYSFPTIPTLALARVLRRPLLWSPRGSLMAASARKRGGLKRAWLLACRAAGPRGLVFHATSEEEAAECRRRFPGIDAVVIGNGVEIPERASKVCSNGVLRLLYLGRLHPIKAIDKLLAACAVIPQPLRWLLTIAGPGEAGYRGKLQQLIRELGLGDRVRLAGEVLGEAKENLFGNSDVLVLPSHSENFGMVVAEALAHSVPVIASTNTPWKEVEQVGCGLWVDNSPDTLARAIQRIAQMPLEEMGARGRDWMRARFGWDSRATQMAGIYRDMIDRIPALPAKPRSPRTGHARPLPL